MINLFEELIITSEMVEISVDCAKRAYQGKIAPGTTAYQTEPTPLQELRQGPTELPKETFCGLYR